MAPFSPWSASSNCRWTTRAVRPVPLKVYTEEKPGIQPGGDSSGYTNLGTALGAWLRIRTLPASSTCGYLARHPDHVRRYIMWLIKYGCLAPVMESEPRTMELNLRRSG